jgi:hypothetical protein
MKTEKDRNNNRSSHEYSLREVLDRVASGEAGFNSGKEPRAQHAGEGLRWQIRHHPHDTRVPGDDDHDGSFATLLMRHKTAMTVGGVVLGFCVAAISTLSIFASGQPHLEAQAATRISPSRIEVGLASATSLPSGALNFAASPLLGASEDPSRTPPVAARRVPILEIAPTTSATKTIEANLGARDLGADVQRRVGRLSVANVVTSAGELDTAWPMALSADGPQLPNAKVVIVGLPATARLNRGTFGYHGVWTLTPAELADLKVTMPPNVGTVQLTVSLTTNDGTTGDGLQLERTNPTIEVRPVFGDVSPATKTRLDAQTLTFIEQGESRLAEGDVIGARMFFKKAADSDDARAAIGMGSTYDPNVFASLNVHGMVPDVSEARRWYQRASKLGSTAANERLDRLGAL